MRPLFVLVALTSFLVASTALATPEEDGFEKLYGAQVKKVQSQRDPAVTQEFVQSLMQDAGELKDDPKLQAVILIRAYEVALRAGSLPLCESAIERHSPRCSARQTKNFSSHLNETTDRGREGNRK
jgi:hypothetical protein